MKPPKAKANKPCAVVVTAGKSYLWCACGQSTTQPFCDGKSHLGSGIKPIPYSRESTDKIWFCVCKQSANKPFCDGSHKRLKNQDK